MELYRPDRIGIESNPQRGISSESHRAIKDTGYEQDAVLTLISKKKKKSNCLTKVWQDTFELLWYSGCDPSRHNTDSRYGAGGPT